MLLDLKVTGMMCDGCANSVTKALKAIGDLVKSVEVNLEDGVVEVEVAAETIGDALEAYPALIFAVTEAGFEAEAMLPPGSELVEI
eukprot:CAMPEP_0196584866 /NCGR_PEP_ID=MMETSP1081-20130531/48782_1 /TAXON_ID=36882 /ORGANISM="Pyramimonas amylifera, Strain CCMP720" /LENGTH=85 /DNA_ID=CAMNT_0041906231 /DNA_START=321 /DNA_END=578 /DNA_ORIENTATION=+